MVVLVALYLATVLLSAGYALTVGGANARLAVPWRSQPVVVAALGVLAAGAAVFLTSPPASFGWFAYAPLTDQPFAPSGGTLILTGQETWGVLLAAVALGALVGVGGYVLGRRRGART